jgi:hypothetical protein
VIDEAFARQLLDRLNRGTWLPDRVMVDEFKAGRPVAGTLIDVVFIRHDGWTLGARWDLEDAARQTWHDHWTFTLRRTPDGWRLDDSVRSPLERLRDFVARGQAAQRAVDLLTPTYVLHLAGAPGRPPAIRCLLCGAVSYHRDDIANRYCGACHLPHDLVAEARLGFSAGAGHECADWPTARQTCAICGALLT